MRRLTADRPIVGMPSELGQVMAAARAREQAGERVLHLERGEPDFDTPGFIIEALAAAARAGETHYPDSRGTLPLREALVEKLARAGLLDQLRLGFLFASHLRSFFQRLLLGLFRVCVVEIV